MRKTLLTYFEFTRSERNGTLALAIICVLAFAAPDLVRLFKKPRTTDFSSFRAEIDQIKSMGTPVADNFSAPVQQTAKLFSFDPNTATFEDFTRLGLTEKLANTILNYRNKGGKFYDTDDFKKMYGLSEADFERLEAYIDLGEMSYSPKEKWAKKDEKVPSELFAFDPNTASDTDLKRLGLPEKTVATLLKYREKGGKFKDKSDLKKLYGLSEKDYDRINPYIQIVPPAAAAKPVMYATTPPVMGPKSTISAAVINLDINQSSPEDWQKLPLIGVGRAKSITNYRDRLGGFTTVEQVAEVLYLPDSVFQLIRPMLKASPVLRKINLNTATAEELDAHPYIDRKQTDLILVYRAQHGKFRNVQELASIGAFRDRAWLDKVMAYLTVE